MLKTLVIDYKDGRTVGSVVVDLSVAPKLVELRTSESKVELAFGDATLHNLRCVEIYPRLSMKDCWLILRHCPSISRFHGTILPHKERVPLLETIPTRLSSNIVNLTLCSHGNLDALLDNISLPMLRVLEIVKPPPYNPVVAPWPHLTQPLQRSQSPLDSLRIIGAPMTEADIIQCLQQVPLITFLHLENLPVKNDTFCALTAFPPRSTMCLCPRLRVLRMGGPELSEANMEALVVSRCYDADGCLDEKDYDEEAITDRCECLESFEVKCSSLAARLRKQPGMAVCMML